LIIPAEISYFIDGQEVALVNGQAEQVATVGAASSIKTSIFEANTQGDINDDGLSDVVVILTQERGGSGTFYYVAVAVGTAEGYRGTNAVLLGDRIAPQSTQIKNGVIIVNYAERVVGDSYEIAPSVGVSKYLVIQEGDLREISYYDDLLEVYSPGPKDYIESPLVVLGRARGSWFFEGSFPVFLFDDLGQVIATAQALAESEWTTDEYVSFSAELDFERPGGQVGGQLIFASANPSGLPENERNLGVPISFK
jgi:hypothetical protein